MTTTLAQESQRSQDGTFRSLVKASLARQIPNIIGETVGSVSGGVTLTQPMIDKRHAWALSWIASPDFHTERAALLLAGETQVAAVDPVGSNFANVPDATIDARVIRLVNDLAGVKAGE